MSTSTTPTSTPLIDAWEKKVMAAYEAGYEDFAKDIDAIWSELMVAYDGYVIDHAKYCLIDFLAHLLNNVCTAFKDHRKYVRKQASKQKGREDKDIGTKSKQKDSEEQLARDASDALLAAADKVQKQQEEEREQREQEKREKRERRERREAEKLEREAAAEAAAAAAAERRRAEEAEAKRARDRKAKEDAARKAKAAEDLVQLVERKAEEERKRARAEQKAAEKSRAVSERSARQEERRQISDAKELPSTSKPSSKAKGKRKAVSSDPEHSSDSGSEPPAPMKVKETSRSTSKSMVPTERAIRRPRETIAVKRIVKSFTNDNMLRPTRSKKNTAPKSKSIIPTDSDRGDEDERVDDDDEEPPIVKARNRSVANNQMTTADPRCEHCDGKDVPCRFKAGAYKEKEVNGEWVVQTTAACEQCHIDKVKCGLYSKGGTKVVSMPAAGLSFGTTLGKYAEVLRATDGAGGSGVPQAGVRGEGAIPRDLGELLVGVYKQLGVISEENAELRKALTSVEARLSALGETADNQGRQLGDLLTQQNALDAKLEGIKGFLGTKAKEVLDLVLEVDCAAQDRHADSVVEMEDLKSSMRSLQAIAVPSAPSCSTPPVPLPPSASVSGGMTGSKHPPMYRARSKSPSPPPVPVPLTLKVADAPPQAPVLSRSPSAPPAPSRSPPVAPRLSPMRSPPSKTKETSQPRSSSSPHKEVSPAPVPGPPFPTEAPASASAAGSNLPSASRVDFRAPSPILSSELSEEEGSMTDDQLPQSHAGTRTRSAKSKRKEAPGGNDPKTQAKKVKIAEPAPKGPMGPEEPKEPPIKKGRPTGPRRGRK